MKQRKKEKPIRTMDEFRRKYYPDSYARGDFEPRQEKIIVIFPRPGV